MGFLAALWARLPVIVRAVLVGLLLTAIGTLPWQVLFEINIKAAPSVPWSVPLAVAYLGLYWQYLGGRGWPRSTADARRRSAPSSGKRARTRASGSAAGPSWRWGRPRSGASGAWRRWPAQPAAPARVSPARFERTTCGLGNRRSVLLSYGDGRAP